jgi:FkbM family methyltransferase
MGGDPRADRAAIQAAIDAAVGDRGSAAVVDEMAAARIEGAHTVSIEVVALPEVLRQLGDARIDLLKLDAEGAETGILGSLAADDWQRIDRIVMEVHGAPTELR